jgi:hypothetical protein
MPPEIRGFETAWLTIENDWMLMIRIPSNATPRNTSIEKIRSLSRMGAGTLAPLTMCPPAIDVCVIDLPRGFPGQWLIS